MRTLLSQIQTSLDINLYYLSLIGTLTIPDIAGALDSNGCSDWRKYVKWYDQYVSTKDITGEDCYRFRCSLLHQGTSHLEPKDNSPKSSYERIIFVEPQQGDISSYHNIKMRIKTNDIVLCINVKIFCMEVIKGAYSWLDKVECTQIFQENYTNFARRHPNGIPPYITGLPIIG